MAAASSAADAKPITGPERHMVCHQRGSNTRSETNAMRRGISSSSSEASADARQIQPIQLFAAALAAAHVILHDARSCRVSSPTTYAFKSSIEQLIPRLRC